MVTYVDEHKGRFGVEPICKVLRIAPSTYYTHQSLRHAPERRSARAQRDDDLKLEIQRIWDDNFRVYGVRKVWCQLKREGHVVARCTVARLMRELGLRGFCQVTQLSTTMSGMKQELSYRGYRFPPDIISRAVWLSATRSRLKKLSPQESRGPPVLPGESRGMNQELP